MKFKTIIAIISMVFLPMVASAQTQQAPATVAIQLNNVINTWALTLEAQAKQIEDLQKQLAAEKAKQEPKK